MVLGFGTSNRAEIILEQMADQMRARGNSNVHTMGEVLVMFNPAWARTLAEQGWSRQRIQAHLWQRARRRLGDFRCHADGTPAVSPDDAYYWWPEWVDQSNPDEMIPVATSPESIHVIVTGADSLPYGRCARLGGARRVRRHPAAALTPQVGLNRARARPAGPRGARRPPRANDLARVGAVRPRP